MPDRETTLLLARHGDVSGIQPPRFRGRADPPLSESGRHQASELADRLRRSCTVDVVHTSPRRRCQETARAFTAEVGLDPGVSDVLDDVDYGGWTWRTHEEVEADYPEPYAEWRSHPELTRFPNGESLQDLTARAFDGLRAILGEAAGSVILVVTHDSVIRALVLQITGLPMSFYHQLTISPCSLSEIRYKGFEPTLVRLNDAAHVELGT